MQSLTNKEEEHLLRIFEDVKYSELNEREQQIWNQAREKTGFTGNYIIFLCLLSIISFLIGAMAEKSFNIIH